MPDDKVIPVRVALRCRPLVSREVAEGCQICLQFVEGEPQVILGTDRAFTYDYVFGPDTSQKYVYESTVSTLVEGLFKGYNATVLAYGQTGSGKTFSMGGAYGLGPNEDEDIIGIIPRVIRDLFVGVKEKEDEHVFTVKVSYLEIYKEELLDLLVPVSKREKDSVAVREDVNGGIKVTGLKEVTVRDEDDTMKCLEDGSLGRTTGATAMNSTSSRSHAIFTIFIERTSKSDSQDCCKAKFHLVDLAGSERQKKTRAEGNRFKEGVNINMGLLALGNVISALGDEAQKRAHIPYRDSKLTRLLQDSLGGNSHTVMIACVSPADSNMEETLSTLRYADRARKIKNKPVVNRDPQTAEILRLRGMVQQLQMQMMANGGTIGSLGNTPNTSFEQVDVKALKARLKELEEENDKLVNQIQNLFDQNANLVQKMISIEEAKDRYKESLEEIKTKTGAISRLSMTIMNQGEGDPNESIAEQSKIFQELQSMVDDLNAESEELETIPEEDENVQTSTSSQMSTPEKKAGERKAVLHNELMQLNDQLTKKEEFVKLLMKNEENFSKQRKDEDEEKLKSEIERLQKDLEDANQQLKSASSNATSKISEQRRQRVKELEQTLTGYKKRLVDYSKVVKMKEQMSKDLTRVNSEILALKQTRVRLMKQIKEETENFRKFRQQKEKEVTQLKAKDRRRQVEFIKMERQHEMQQVVLRRKAEQAAAANKRLKEALAKQQGAAEERAKAQERQAGTMQERLKKFINTEYELASSIEEARRHRQSLIDDRKTISEKLNRIRAKLEAPPSKRRTLNNSQRGDSEEQDALRKQVKQLEAEIELRNASIQDLSEKLMKADQEDKSKYRWNSIHSVVESKVALAHLLTKAVKSRVHASDMTSKMEEMRVELDEAIQAAETAEKELKAAKHDYDADLSEIKRNHEKRVLLILSQWNETGDDSVNDRMRIQREELEQMDHLHDELDKREEELKNARQLLTKASYTKGNMSLMPDFDTPREKLFVTPKKRVAGRKRKSEDVDSDCLESDVEEEEEADITKGDEKFDMDWKPGYTPGFTARLQPRRTKMFSRSDFDVTPDDAGNNEAEPVRLSAPIEEDAEDKFPLGTSCKCKGDCGTKRCMCRKSGMSCMDNCKCPAQKCQNRAPELPQSTTDDSELEKQQAGDSLNSTFTMNKAVVETASEDSGSTDASRSVLSETQNTQFYTSKRVSETSADETIEKGGVKKRRLKQPGKQFFSDPAK